MPSKKIYKITQTDKISHKQTVNLFVVGDGMKVYLDVLIFLNSVVDFLIIALTERLGKQKCRLARKIIAAIISSLFSLAVFLPTANALFQATIRLVCSVVTVLIAFGYKKMRVFLRNIMFFYVASFLYVGIMIGVWFVFKPQSLVINNSVVYLDVSPLLIVSITFLSFLVISFCRHLTSKTAAVAERCEISVILGEKTVRRVAMLDTGHTARDPLSDREIIFAESGVFVFLLGEEKYSAFCDREPEKMGELSNRVRLISCGGVAGEGIVTGLRCDKALIFLKQGTKTLESPILALSNVSFGDDFDLILSAEAVSQSEENSYAT